MSETRTPKPVILSVDDDGDAQLLLRLAFTKASISARLMVANDGSEAIEYLSGTAKYADRSRFPFPDLVLLDLKMPVTGFEVLKFIREKGDFPLMRVVVFSTSNSKDDVTRAYEMGCHSYVVKPGSFDELVELIRLLTGHLPGRQSAPPDLLRPAIIAQSPNA